MKIIQPHPNEFKAHHAPGIIGSWGILTTLPWRMQ